MYVYQYKKNEQHREHRSMNVSERRDVVRSQGGVKKRSARARYDEIMACAPECNCYPLRLAQLLARTDDPLACFSPRQVWSRHTVRLRYHASCRVHTSSLGRFSFLLSNKAQTNDTRKACHYHSNSFLFCSPKSIDQQYQGGLYAIEQRVLEKRIFST